LSKNQTPENVQCYGIALLNKMLEEALLQMHGTRRQGLQASTTATADTLTHLPSTKEQPALLLQWQHPGHCCGSQNGGQCHRCCGLYVIIEGGDPAGGG
jgi:hypothetical protein